MQSQFPKTALALLLSLGVVACSSGGGASTEAVDRNTAELAKQSEALAKLTADADKAQQSSDEEIKRLNNEISQAKTALEEAKKKLEAANQTLTNNKDTVEKAEQAKRDYEQAKQALANFQSALAAEEARRQAQIKAEQEERERLEAEWRKQEEERQKAWEEEQARLRAEEEKRQKEWEEEQARLEAERQAEEAKRKAEEEKIAVGNYSSDEALWRFAMLPQHLVYYPEEAHNRGPEKIHNGRYASQNDPYFEDTAKGSLNTYAKFHEFPVADKIETLPLTAVKTNTRFANGEEVIEKVSSEIGKIAFTNQQYASYWVTKSLGETTSENYSDGSSDYHLDWNIDKAGYVALPTVASQSDVIKNGATATYTGKIIEGNYDKTVTTRPNPNSSGDHDTLLYKVTYTPKFTSGDFSLTANFGQGKVEGMITNRESGQPDIQLEQGNIKLNDLSGDNKMVRFEGTAKYASGNIPQSLGTFHKNYQGVFAGPNAEEVVGNVGDNISFGGKR